MFKIRTLKGFSSLVQSFEKDSRPGYIDSGARFIQFPKDNLIKENENKNSRNHRKIRQTTAGNMMQ